MTKYELIPDPSGLFRIRALINIPRYGVHVGDLGGLIEKEDNLDHNGNCWCEKNSCIFGNARVSGNALICDVANIHGYAKVYGNARVYGNAKVYGNAIIYGNAEVYDNAQVYDNARVYGNAVVCGEAWICEDAQITKTSDYIIFKNFWSSGRHFTWTGSNNMWKVGCFYGTGEELIKKAYADSEISGREYERVVKYVESILEEQDEAGKNV